ncbi:MAG: hypothetical protein LQ340_003033 [Diploschistes diacapsis]|nr:MAG: hypothetical protein LQ340_003033 [Diploschistes diacapsis]
MPLDHFFLSVPPSKYEGVISFLLTSLAHMGFREFRRPIPLVAGLGDSSAFLWINGLNREGVDDATLDLFASKNHIAFTAENNEQVRQFHEAAIKAGGKEEGAPGERPQYHPGYYGAFVRDPLCGINFEVVCHNGPGYQ